jgi:hypothetical protein
VARIDCTIPIKVVVRGRPGPEQLAALGDSLARALESRLREASARIRARSGPRPEEAVRAPIDPGRWDATGGYRIPSYEDNGKPTTVVVRGAGRREATVQVRWIDDREDFFDRLVHALRRSGRFGGVPFEAFGAVAGTSGRAMAGFRPSVDDFYRAQRGRTRGQRIDLRVSARYDPSPGWWTPPLTDVAIDVVEKGVVRPVAPVVAPEPTKPPAPPARRADETAEQRLERELVEVSNMLGWMLVHAAERGANGARFTVEFDGRILTPTRGDLVGPQVQPDHDCLRKPGTAGFSEARAAHVVRGDLDNLVRLRQPRVLEIYYCFAAGLQMQKFTIEAPAPPPPPSRPGVSPDELLAEEIAHYKAWYTFAQKTIVEGLAEHDPTKPKNLVWTAATVLVPIGMAKFAKSMNLIESTEGMVSTAGRVQRADAVAKEVRQGERAADLTKNIRKTTLVERGEALRLKNKYAARVGKDTDYPPQAWGYIEELEKRFPELVAAELRPVRRPRIVDDWVRNERMQTSQGNYSFAGTRQTGRAAGDKRTDIQLDDISLDGFVKEVKHRTQAHVRDRRSFEIQLESNTEFVRKNKLSGVIWEVDDTATEVEVLLLIKDKIKSGFLKTTDVVKVRVVGP